MVWDENVLEKCLVLITLLFYIVVHELFIVAFLLDYICNLIKKLLYVPAIPLVVHRYSTYSMYTIVNIHIINTNERNEYDFPPTNMY